SYALLRREGHDLGQSLASAPPRLGGRAAVVDDDRLRGEVTDALEPARDQHGREAETVGERQKIHGPQEVSKHGVPESERVAADAHHSHAEEALAGSSAPPERLEEPAVAPFEQEYEEEEDADRESGAVLGEPEKVAQEIERHERD